MLLRVEDLTCEGGGGGGGAGCGCGCGCVTACGTVLTAVLVLGEGAAWGVALLPDTTEPGEGVGLLGVLDIAGGGSLSLAIIPTLSRVARKDRKSVV